MKKFLTFIMMLVVSTSLALAKDIETVVFTTQPQMHCSNCEAKIKKALRFEKGVKDIVTNVPRQTVMVKYDEDKTTVAKLIKALEKIGYYVRVVAASDDDVRCKYNVKCNKTAYLQQGQAVLQKQMRQGEQMRQGKQMRQG